MPQMGSLGRGMDAVTAPPQDEGAGENVQNLRVDLIDPNPDQPREVFDPDALEDLEASIAVDGILQPIVVRPPGERSTLGMGERRELASSDKQAMLIGQGNKFELWDEEIWNQKRDEWLNEEDDGDLPPDLESMSF